MYELLPYIVFAIGLILILGKLSLRVLRNLKMIDGNKWRRLLFIVPANTVNPFDSHGKGDARSSEDLYRRLHELNIPFGLEAVVRELGEEIYFYVIVEQKNVEKVHSLVESLWPTGYLNRDENEDFWSGNHSSTEPISGGYFSLKQPYAIPLRTHSKEKFEPFLSFLKKLSGLATVGEGAVLQATVKPADEHLILAVGKYLDQLENGTYSPSRHIHPEFVVTPESIKIIREKISSPLFAVNLRLVAYDAKKSSSTLLKNIAETLSPPETHSQYNQFNFIIPKRQDVFIEQLFSYSFEPAQEIILSAKELSTYFHLPGPETKIAKIKR